MVLAHDAEVALGAAAALVNTGRSAVDALSTMAELDQFVRDRQYTGARTGTAAELQAVRALRPTLAALWESDEDEVVSILNDLLRAGRALPQLIRHDDWDYHIHATAADAPLADRIAVEVAMACSDAVRLKELDRLRTCAGSDCSDVYVDLSKNRSRRFCSVSCGNRANVAAYRARRR